MHQVAGLVKDFFPLITRMRTPFIDWKRTQSGSVVVRRNRVSEDRIRHAVGAGGNDGSQADLHAPAPVPLVQRDVRITNRSLLQSVGAHVIDRLPLNDIDVRNDAAGQPVLQAEPVGGTGEIDDPIGDILALAPPGGMRPDDRAIEPHAGIDTGVLKANPPAHLVGSVEIGVFHTAVEDLRSRSSPRREGVERRRADRSWATSPARARRPGSHVARRSGTWHLHQ